MLPKKIDAKMFLFASCCFVIGGLALFCMNFSRSGYENKVLYVKEFANNGGVVSVYFTELKPTKSHTIRAMKKYSWVWGFDGRTPDRYLSEFRLRVDNNLILVPEVVYDDLFDLDLLSLDAVFLDSGILLSINGGDAESAYTSKFLFSKNGVLNFRRVSYRDGGPSIEADLNELKNDGFRESPLRREGKRVTHQR